MRTCLGIFCVLIALVLCDGVLFQTWAKGEHGSHHGRSGGDVAVKPHIRRDGTYVQPHHRNSPNTTQRDNFSSRPNVNPYIGKPGTRIPDR